MGFPSPATVYIEQRLLPADICMTADSLIIETADGYAIIESMIEPVLDEVLLILSEGQTQFAKIRGRSLITSDGEAIESESLSDIEVLGRVTFFINRATEDNSPA